MTRKLLLLTIILSVMITPGLAYERIWGWCSIGGVTVTTGGNTGTPLVIGSYPGCNVQVNLTGTTTPAVIYSDNNGTPLSNPFQADVVTGYWYFYAANGIYDAIQTGGGLATPVTLGAVTAFDPTTLPATPVPGGIQGSVQYNSSGVFTGNPYFVWSDINQNLTITASGTFGKPGLLVQNSYIQSQGGFLSNHLTVPTGQITGYTSFNDGYSLAGGVINQNASVTQGGYLHLTPVTYNPYDSSTPCHDQWGNVVQQPLPLGGDSFNAVDSVLWVGTSPSIPSNGSCGIPIGINSLYGLNTNNYIFARGGFATDNSQYNSIQSLLGGLYVKLGVTADQGLYLNAWPGCTGLNSPLPSPYGGFAYSAGSVYCYFNQTTGAWLPVDLSVAGGGGATGPANSVQYNSGTGLAGSANLAWLNGSQILNIVAKANQAGLNIQNGYAISDVGYVANPATATTYNAFQAVNGGMTGRSFTATAYVQTGNSSGVPTISGGDGFHAGAMYYDTGAGAEKLYNGSSWVSLAGGSGSPGGSNKSIQYNTSGSFGGDGNITWDPTAQIQNIVGKVGQAGLDVQTGYILSDGGFVANPSTATTYNAIQATAGGAALASVTATRYVQTGNSTGVPFLTGGDGFHAGAMYYDLGVGSEQLYNGTSWVSLGGGSGSPGGITKDVQYNSGGVLAGSGGLFIWDNGLQLLAITTTSGSTAGISVSPGFIQAVGGFTALTCPNYTCIQAPSGGVTASSLEATYYTQTGKYTSTPPPLTFGDGFQAGTLFFNTTLGSEMVYNGSTWNALGGVTSLNTLSGALTIAPVANQTTVSQGGSTVTVGTVQNIGTTSSVAFGTVTSQGTIKSASTGTSITFQNSNNNFSVDGNGDISFAGILAANGSAGGINVTGNGASNSNQSVGGFNTGSLGTLSGNAVVTAGTYSSGGSFTGTGTCQMNLSGNATATVIITSGVVVAGSALTITGPGNGYSVAPSLGVFPGSPICTGGATASGAVVVVTIIGNGVYEVGGIPVIDSGRGAHFSGAVTVDAGIATAPSSSSNITIGPGGAFYDFTFTGAGAPSCVGIRDGWMGYNVTTNILYICGGGTAHAH